MRHLALLFCVYALFTQQVLCQCAYPVNLQFHWERSFPLSSQCLAIKHDSLKPFIYVAGKERGLLIYNVADINNPIQVDSVPISLMNNMQVVNVEQSGNYVYLSLGNLFSDTAKGGMAIVDVTDPANAVFKTYWAYNAAAGGGGIVKVSGDYACYGAMRRGLFILNIADKNNIAVVSHLELSKNWPNPASPDSLKYNARGMALRGNYAYVCYDAGGLRVIDITDKANPVEIGKYSNPAVYNKARAYNNIILDDSIAYIGSDYCGMEVLNISDPANITQIGWWNPWACETPANTWVNSDGYINQMVYNKPCGLVFMSGGTTDLAVVNVADPANPQLCSTFGNAGDTLATWGLDVYRDQVYLSYIYYPIFCIPFCAYWPGMKMLTWNNTCDLEVKEHQADQLLTVYPNPASNQVLISNVPIGDQPAIYDITGRMLATRMRRSGNDFILRSDQFARGSYIIKCKGAARRLVVN